MPNTAPQIGEILIGEVANIAIDCSGFLDTGETITGAVTVEEQTTSELTITSEQANSAELTINGAAVAVGLAVQCRVDAASAAAGDYTLIVTAVTSASQTRKGKVQLSVAAA